MYIGEKSVTASFNIIEDKDEVKIKFKVVIRFGRDEATSYLEVKRRGII